MGGCCGNSLGNTAKLRDELTKPLSEWTVEHVACWLEYENQGTLKPLKHKFVKHEVAGKALERLEESHFKDMDIKKVGLRLQFIELRNKLLKEKYNLSDEDLPNYNNNHNKNRSSTHNNHINNNSIINSTTKNHNKSNYTISNIENDIETSKHTVNSTSSYNNQNGHNNNINNINNINNNNNNIINNTNHNHNVSYAKSNHEMQPLKSSTPSSTEINV